MEEKEDEEREQDQEIPQQYKQMIAGAKQT
jgi:hypothetical protein